MSDPHVIITGPQRSGKATALEILTRCNMDTGFTVKDFEEGTNEFFEFNFWGEHYMREPPYIIKHPKLAKSLKDRTDMFDWKIDHVYIFIRNVDESVEKTVALKRGISTRQAERRFYNRLGRIIYQCVEYDWKYTIISSDKFIQDWTYANMALYPLTIGIRDHVFEKAWNETMERRNANR